MSREIRPFGTWLSPITGESLTRSTVSFGELHSGGDELWWVEGRPAEGRSVLVCNGVDLTPEGFSLGSRVHGYGGASVTIHDGLAYVVEKKSQRVYRVERGSEPFALTPEDALRRYGDIWVDSARRRLLAVCEDHRNADTDNEPENLIVSIPIEGGEPEPLLRGRDFFVNPRVSPDGASLAWVTWDHPNMPWDGTELRIGRIGSDGSVSGERVIAGGRRESVGFPVWGSDGTLYFVSDRSGWWNLYTFDGTTTRAVAPMEAEWGVPGLRRESFVVIDECVVASIIAAGESRLVRVQLPRSGGHAAVEEIGTGFTANTSPRFVAGRIAFVGASATTPTSLCTVSIDGGDPEVVRAAAPEGMGNERYRGEPETITYPTEGGMNAHAFYYAPRSPDFEGPPGERPPLIVQVHGGPVGATSRASGMGGALYWTSRGYAYVDLNYRGSIGYGRAYREALYGLWGIADVEDAEGAVRFLADRGDIDPQRVAIRGGSAGGYTTLAAVTTSSVFAAGTARYPVSDLERFVETTHKYESHYMEQLIGSWENERPKYKERSPLSRVSEVRVPLLLLQGLEDKVCPPDQSEAMVEALRAQGKPVEYVAFEGEGHGLSKAENMVKAIETEEAFYAGALRLGALG